MHKLAIKTQKLCAITLSKAGAMSEIVKDATNLLQPEADRYLIHHDLRAAIWVETTTTSKLLRLPYATAEKITLFRKWSERDGGFMSQLMHLASMRPALHDYSATKAIDDNTRLVIVSRPSGCMDFVGKGEVLSFVEEWKGGVAIDHVINVFVRSSMDDLAEWAIGGMRIGLDALRMDGLREDSPQECDLGLAGILTKSLVDDIGVRPEMVDKFVSDRKDLAEWFSSSLKSSSMLQPFRDIQAVGYDISLKCKLVFDDDPVPLIDSSRILEQCAHIADMISLVTFLGACLLANTDNWILPRTGQSRNSPSTPLQIAPPVFTFISAAQVASGLSLTQKLEGSTKFEAKHMLRYPSAMLKSFVMHISTKWLEVVKKFVSTTIATEFEAVTEALKAKTPSYGHIITFSTYNNTLEKMQLLNYGSLHLVAELIDDSTSLRASMAQFIDNETMTSWGIMMESDGVVCLAKTALAVVAGVGLVESPPSAEISQMASRLLEDRTANLPESLKAKLRTLVTT